MRDAGRQPWVASGEPTSSARLVRYGSPDGRWVLAATVLGSALAFIDATVVNIALPRIGAELGADAAGLQWTVNGYTLSLASLILLGGSLSDRFGRRRIFVVGVGWFAGEVSGCGRFAADCDPAVTPLTWLVQVAILAALLVVPFLARIAAIAAVATLAVSLSGALLLSPTAGGDDPGAGRAALGVLIVIAWAAGIVVALVREARRSVPTGPVS